MIHLQEAVPPHVLAAFEGQPHLTMPQLAKVLKMDRKTLDRHREAQNLPVHIKGTGLERRHYVCTLADVAEFYHKTNIDNGTREPVFEAEPVKPTIPPRRPNFKTGRKKANRTPGFIYFVSTGDFIKIGWSKDWKKRIAILQIANPEPLKVLGVCAGTILEENGLHFQFERHRVSGEWHAAHPDILEYIASIDRIDDQVST